MKALIAIALLFCSSAYANADQRPDQQKRPGPPPEALKVCEGKAAGSAVTMKTPRGDTIKGVCRMVMIPERDGPGGER